MPIAITDTQRALAGSIRDWAARTNPVDAVAAGTAGDCWSSLAGIGLLGIAVSEQRGGAGGTIADAAAGLEAAATALAPGPVLPTMLAAVLLDRHPGAADELVSRLVSGEAHAGVAIEDGTLTARRGEAGDLVIDGDAGLVLGADEDAVLLLAVSVGNERRWLVVAPHTPGVEVEPATPLDASQALATVRLNEAVAPPSAVIPGLDDAVVRDMAVTLAAAEASGVAVWCLRTASEYAAVREQFGKKIGAFQAVKHLCAQALCRAEQASALAWDAARAADDDADQHAFAGAIAGAAALDAAVDNAKDCIQVLGGIGFTWEHHAHRYLRRAVALRQLFGAGRWRTRAAALALRGSRRTIEVDLGEGDIAEQTRQRIRAEVEDIAAAPEGEQRVRLAESGYLVPHWPKPYGLDASPALQLAIDAELGRAGVGRPNLIIGGWASATILRHGTAEQRERFLLPTLRGELAWCQLFSEPEAGSDLASLRTKASKVDGGWLLTGQKVWTSLAVEADWAICLARTDPDAPKHQGITYFLVDMTAGGIETRPLREITGIARFNEVFLSEVFVPDTDVVGEVNGGWRLARTTLANERVAMSGGSSLGESLERLLALVRERDLADEVGAERLGGLIADGAACSVLELRSVLGQLTGKGPGAESSVQKLLGVRHRQEVAELALDLLGPDGAIEGEAGHDIAHEFLLSRCLSIAGGTTQVLLNVAAERLLGLPRG